jgi:hypothetical protein
VSSSPDSREEGDGGELIQAAFAADEIEAEVIQGLLESAGIPSLLQPTGFTGPQMLGGLVGAAAILDRAGSQRVMVYARRIEEARAVLAEAAVNGEDEWPEFANAGHLDGGGGRGLRNYGFVGACTRIFLVAIGFFALTFAIFLLSRAL